MKRFVTIAVTVLTACLLYSAAPPRADCTYCGQVTCQVSAGCGNAACACAAPVGQDHGRCVALDLQP